MDWDSFPISDQDIYNSIRSKKYELWCEAQKRRSKEMAIHWEKEARRPWTPQEMWDYIHRFAEHKLKLRYQDAAGEWKSGLEVDDHNRDVLMALCAYYTGDEKQFLRIGKKEFGELGAKWDIDKGIFLWGPVGTGKSTTMALFQINKRMCFDMISARLISDAYVGSKNPTEVIKGFSHIKYNPSNDIDKYFQKTMGLHIEDLGTEDTVAKNFGNSKNVLADILLNRYDRFQEGRMTREATSITSNLTPEQVEASYGDRVKDRFREMFNIVLMSGPSRRK